MTVPGASNAPSATVTPLPRVLRPRRAVPSDAVRPTRAEINLANLRHNLRVLAETAGTTPVYSVLKADGYGHGAKAVARTLERAGATGVCVALLEEAIELREAGIRVPIIVMGGYYGRAYGELLQHNLTPALHDTGQLEALAEEVRFSGAEPVRAHLKIDTGMGRLGAMPCDVETLADSLRAHPEVQLEGLMTHFACADSDRSPTLDEQLDVFDQVTESFRALGIVPNVRHAANSSALFRSARSTLDLVRPGISLFGVQPHPGACPRLRAVMRVQSEIIALRSLPAGTPVGYGASFKTQRQSCIATIAMGYADGLSRALSNRGEVLVRGRRAPIVGVVSMDMTMVDVTDVPGVSLRDEVVLLGSQKGPLGDDTIAAEELAERSGTIAYEVLTNISRRVPRFYREP